ncbi:MAG: glycoside hydrolase family 125 protein [Brachybacterium sp.]|nr:glycoside hydrolase family 125 protein [Brachybacterium sp.]
MVHLPDSLLKDVRKRLLTGLAAHPADPADSTAEGGDGSGAEDQEITERVLRYLRNTAETTVDVEGTDVEPPERAGTTFVTTGDSPAMGLRDAAAPRGPRQRPHPGGVLAGEDRQWVEDLLVGLLHRHWFSIALDPYANAFNRTASGDSWDEDETEAPSDWTWERKFELDSLSYGPDLAWRLWRATGRTDVVGGSFREAARRIVETVETEQHHEERSAYFFRRQGVPAQDTLARDGRGQPTTPCGLVWSGFRPSDDACEMGFNVPGNHYLALALDRLADLLDGPASTPADGGDGPSAEGPGVDSGELAQRARELCGQIRAALAEHGTMRLADGTQVWAYEVDGGGGALFLDDANVPSLLSLPYLGCTDPEDPLYAATRRAVLSPANPYYYAGSALSGVGSPHTPPGHVWPIGLAIQGLTSTDDDEKRRILRTLMRTDGGTGMMHEGVDAEDPSRFTRAWFSWANAMFCELALDLAGVRPSHGTG